MVNDLEEQSQNPDFSVTLPKIELVRPAFQNQKMRLLILSKPRCALRLSALHMFSVWYTSGNAT